MDFIEIKVSRDQGLRFIQNMARSGFPNYTAKKGDNHPLRPEFNIERFMQKSGPTPLESYEVLLGLEEAGAIIRVRPEPSPGEDMKLMIQVSTTTDEAELFMNSMKDQGYECRCDGVEGYRFESHYFKFGGETTINHSIFIDREEATALIGIRPR
jgi:hypothetical protein